MNAGNHFDLARRRIWSDPLVTASLVTDVQRKFDTLHAYSPENSASLEVCYSIVAYAV